MNTQHYRSESSLVDWWKCLQMETVAVLSVSLSWTSSRNRLATSSVCGECGYVHVWRFMWSVGVCGEYGCVGVWRCMWRWVHVESVGMWMWVEMKVYISSPTTLLHSYMHLPPPHPPPSHSLPPPSHTLPLLTTHQERHQAMPGTSRWCNS